MEKTLGKNSGIIFLKSKFFLIRIVTYFSILLIPIWAQKSLELNTLFQVLLMSLYSIFMASQWFLLGKEIDHRLKIYFRVNSSLDRVVYRIFLGMFAFILIFNLLSLLPTKWVYNSFWAVWVSLGIFYSWPTRGKIIKESVITHFGEFRYLDSFEKTLVGLTIVLFVFSIPELPTLTNEPALKLFFDQNENISNIFWNFLKVSYFPFYKYPELLRFGWAAYFYLIGVGFYLVNFYALLRFFVSRRLSLLGIFALLSSWSFSKILVVNPGATLSTTYSLLWIWSLIWVTKSSTYRTGLFLGLVSFYGAILNASWIVLMPIQVLLTVFYFLKDKTMWYRKQFLRYMLLGIVLTGLILFSDKDVFSSNSFFYTEIVENFFVIFKRKAFFSLAIFGFIVVVLKYVFPKIKVVKDLQFQTNRIDQLLLCYFLLFVSTVSADTSLVKDFSIMWLLSLFSLFPLEVIFQNISRLRSSRNMIYLIYILICLLDSHFEGRVKIFLRIFDI
ncbi:hypothetical protein OAT67_00440 [Bacteriovoracaceae bacterium]|nr:hypothetical protein [Bacteriovoracaceae bacterium]|tara:strand:+ start:207080 stop:208582 length:1503 start_codon:yes stop_codon:yes gene_type:complete